MKWDCHHYKFYLHAVGVEQVFVHVHRNNGPAQELYQKMGFEVIPVVFTEFMLLVSVLFISFYSWCTDTTSIFSIRWWKWQALNCYRSKPTCFASGHRTYSTQFFSIVCMEREIIVHTDHPILDVYSAPKIGTVQA